MRALRVVFGALGARALGVVCVALVACSSQSTNGVIATGGSTSGGGSGGAAGSGATGGTDFDGSPPDSGGDGCVPKACDDLGAACGKISDGCGNTLTCPACQIPALCENNQCCQPEFGVAQAAGAVSSGSLCNLGYGDIQDDQGVGLDFAGGELVNVDSVAVSSCVTFHFSGSGPKSIVVRARTVNKACTIACTNCSQGNNTSFVFGSADDATYGFVGQNAFGTAFEEHTFTLSAATPYVMVCRGSYDETYRDLEVDSVRTAACP